MLCCTRLNLSKNMSRFNEFADGFEQLPMYFMTFHGQENIKKVIEVSFVSDSSFLTSCGC